MRLLLDTHILLWWLSDDAKLSPAARSRILNAKEVFVSSASIWEAAIKASIGKLDIDVDLLAAEIKNNGFIELPVTARHAAKVVHLPDIHRDPFDRMLVAQAISEPLTLLTADEKLRGYSELVEIL